MSAARSKIEAEAARLARDLAQRREVIIGFGAEIVLENALLEMAIFTLGLATGQEGKAAGILAESRAVDRAEARSARRKTAG